MLKPPRRVVTARYFRDPPPGRAGKAPPCEWSLQQAAAEMAARLEGRDPPADNRNRVIDIDAVRARAELLVPRRYAKKEQHRED